MSGVGKTTVLKELRSRGLKPLTPTTVAGSCPMAPGVSGAWMNSSALSRMSLSGTAENQGHFYNRFEHVVLLSAPIQTLIERVTERTNNPYGKTLEQQAEIAVLLATIGPLLRHGATLELDWRRPVAELADVIEAW